MTVSKAQSVPAGVGHKWLMFPPGHDNLDHRVNRTISAIQASGHDLTVYYETDRLVPGEAGLGADIKEMPGLSRVYFSQIAREIRQHRAEHDQLTVYVHDSGFIGLIICTIASFRKRKGDAIIFDYHDLLEWELCYQSSKFVRSAMLKRALVAMVRFFFKLVLRWFIRLDLIVGISQGQVTQLRDRFGVAGKKTLTAPNTRQKLVGNFRRDGLASILWVGNVSKGRRFEETYALQDLLSAASRPLETKIVLVGKRLNRASDEVVDDYLVAELGQFRTDADIARLTQDWKTVGVFFGWDDDFKTGINSISSVNKIYSYVNTLTPFLIPSNQTNMIECLSVPREFIFDTRENMAVRFRWISENYEAAQDMVGTLKEKATWDADVVSMLENEFAQ